MQLEVDGEPVGAPLEGLYADSYVAGRAAKSKSKDEAKGGQPDDFGYLISLRLWEAASRFKAPRRKRVTK